MKLTIFVACAYQGLYRQIMRAEFMVYIRWYFMPQNDWTLCPNDRPIVKFSKEANNDLPIPQVRWHLQDKLKEWLLCDWGAETFFRIINHLRKLFSLILHLCNYWLIIILCLPADTHFSGSTSQSYSAVKIVFLKKYLYKDTGKL